MTQRLGKYEILEEIGRGGFATVYCARDPDLDREVALKVLDPALMRDPSLVERFRREARAAARLRHPGIVTVYEVGQAGNRLYMAMELLPGPSLKEIVEQEAPLPVERAVALLRPLAEALDYAHAQGLVHRDVKPSNAILSPEGRPVLTDLGLVRAAQESGSAALSLTLSQTGMTLGTPAYMAPEQADPKAQAPVDHRADLYSLGVVAYEILTGQVPFQGDTPLAAAVGHLMEAPPPPRELNPALSESAEGALLKMLAKRPDERFQSAGAFVRALASPVAEAEPVAEAGGRDYVRAASDCWGTG
jgi:serine/threonine protein kinase